MEFVDTLIPAATARRIHRPDYGSGLRPTTHVGFGPPVRVDEASPDTGVVVRAMQNSPAFVREALRSGALGYVTKEAADTDVVEAVRLTASGQRLAIRFRPRAAG